MKKKPLFLLFLSMFFVSCNQNGQTSITPSLSEDSSLTSSEASNSISSMMSSNSEIGFDLDTYFNKSEDGFPHDEVTQFVGRDMNLPEPNCSTYYFQLFYDQNLRRDYFTVAGIEFDEDIVNNYAETLNNAGLTTTVSYEPTLGVNYGAYESETVTFSFYIMKNVFFMDFIIPGDTYDELADYNIYTSFPQQQIKNYIGIRSDIPEIEANEYYGNGTTYQSIYVYEIILKEFPSTIVNDYCLILQEEGYAVSKDGVNGDGEVAYSFGGEDFAAAFGFYESYFVIDIYATSSLRDEPFTFTADPSDNYYPVVQSSFPNQDLQAKMNLTVAFPSLEGYTYYGGAHYIDSRECYVVCIMKDEGSAATLLNDYYNAIVAYGFKPNEFASGKYYQNVISANYYYQIYFDSSYQCLFVQVFYANVN